MIPLKYRKALYCVGHPSLWRALASRVAPTIEHGEALRHLRFNTIVDVGANRGQFSLFSRRLNPQASIIAFEPLAAARTVYERVLGADPRVRCYPVAIGASDGNATMFVTARDDSSSLLPIAEAQKQIFGTTPRATESVTVRRLSQVISASDIQAPGLLKIDVEGTELDVLSGADDLLSRFSAIYVECSYVALCERQALAQDIIAWLQPRGFVVRGVFNQQHYPDVGAVQADFLFVRSDAPPAGPDAGTASASRDAL